MLYKKKTTFYFFKQKCSFRYIRNEHLGIIVVLYSAISCDSIPKILHLLVAFFTRLRCHHFAEVREGIAHTPERGA